VSITSQFQTGGKVTPDSVTGGGKSPFIMMPQVLLSPHGYFIKLAIHAYSSLVPSYLQAAYGSPQLLHMY